MASASGSFPKSAVTTLAGPSRYYNEDVLGLALTANPHMLFITGYSGIVRYDFVAKTFKEICSTRFNTPARYLAVCGRRNKRQPGNDIEPKVVDRVFCRFRRWSVLRPIHL